MITSLCRGVVAASLALAVLTPTAAHADEYTLTEAITSLPIAEEIREGCKRELYPHWKDDDKNGCTARNDVLIAEAIEAPTVGAGCSLTGGVWHSYYDDVLVQGPTGVDIDHMVPLAEVHDSEWAELYRLRDSARHSEGFDLVGAPGCGYFRCRWGRSTTSRRGVAVLPGATS
ncbi:hypothetical protein [Streptomyces goshikiensis]|uniref:hypothetical protein n=1 Tax=Streptomyces goshikiensis TaxID=1942 RepID=UPI002ADF27BF|nr:hypothetical protein [Streptomyces goshikiensis]